jgi:PAS domain S-box-containing protein
MAAALVAKKGDFRLIAEQCSDVVMRIGLDERILYAYPSCARILGWDPARLLGTSALAGVNPEDRPRMEQVVAALKAGEAEEARIIYRANRRQQQDIWVETALRVTRSSETREIDGLVAISRDMTEQNDLQSKLAALATSEGLTGIANRLHFDERLLEEWARAKRDGTPLSLLVVEVDLFRPLCHFGCGQIPLLQMSLLGLNQGIEDGKRESEIASLALEVGDDPLLLTDELLAFAKIAFGDDQTRAQTR